jgi:hypothetical protein
MEAIYLSETSVDFQRTTWRYNQKIEFCITIAVRTSIPTQFSKGIYYFEYLIRSFVGVGNTLP